MQSFGDGFSTLAVNRHKLMDNSKTVTER